MKRYSDYMDKIEVSDTLHQRLAELETPKKRPAAWKKYGAAAAALILVAGAGAWGLSQGGWDAADTGWGWDLPAIITADVGREEIGEPDIAYEDPNDPYVPPDTYRTDGGYEVRDGDMAEYILLPYLNWADADGSSMMDYSLAPPSAISRDAVWDDVQAFMGGEKAMADHLLWDEGMNWGGTFWFLEDGTPQAAALYTGYTNRAYGMRLYLEVMKGGEVPSCVVLPDEYYETSQWQGVKITALKNAGYSVVDGVKLNEWVVSLYSGGTGYKLTLYAVDAAQANELCARFVRYAVAGGFQLDALSADGATPAYYADPTNYSVGEPNWEDSVSEFVPDYDPTYEDGVPEGDSGSDNFYCDCPDCIAGIDHTHPYDPSADN